MSNHGDVIVRFANVTFGYHDKGVLLKDANFSIRENAKVTLMGQNGAGKSTIFRLIMGDAKPIKGEVHLKLGAKIGIAKQVMDRAYLEMTVEDYFATAFAERPRNLPLLIDQALETVNYPLDHKITINRLS
ncbi:MAG: ATP-binding cassette domain-containing protein, partial [Patescibacteria group bacterium]